MSGFKAQSCEEFIKLLASRSSIPGGGGASALVGALGVALGNMVGSLTVGKSKYADVQEDIIELKGRADRLQDDLLALIDKDAEAFEPLSKAYGLPRDTAEEQTYRAQVMEECLRAACEAPLLIMLRCCEAIDLLEEFAAKGSAIAISDAGVGVAFAKAALQGASLNVFINTKMMTDRDQASKINAQAGAMLDEFLGKSDEIYSAVVTRFV